MTSYGEQQSLKLWYDQPADTNQWESGLPIGNGSLGAMVFGGVDAETIQLNEETMWYGKLRDRINPDALDSLPKVRALIRQGALKDAENLAFSGLFATPESQGHYEPLADLKLVFRQDIPHVSEMFNQQPWQSSDYQRSLDLETAIQEIHYHYEGVNYTREVFASYPDKVIVMKLGASEAKAISFRVELSRQRQFESVQVLGQDTVAITGATGGNGCAFCTMVKIEPIGGSVSRLGSYLMVDGCDEVIVYITGRTDYHHDEPKSWCLNTLEMAGLLGYERLRERHVKDYTHLFGTNSLFIKENQPAQVITMPTDQRLNHMIACYKTDESYCDNGLTTLYYQYGRYLLIACSRPGSLPANLQGIWNAEMTPPWGCKYTININTQMNYWPSESCHLSECHEPLFEHLFKMQPLGQKVAKEMYGCRGFVAHHNTDIFGDCSPQDQWMPATIWPMGAAWLCLHLFEHYQFTLDKAFLQRVYPLLADASLFFVDYLTEDEKGRLVTCPSTSPENTYILPNGEKGCLCQGPSMDSQIIGALWANTLEAMEILGIQDELVHDITSRLPRLPQPEIGAHGQLLEWAEDYEEFEVGHRHISHLFALHPGSSISPSRTPELLEAARITLNRRLSSGGGHTGWSRAWIINMWARLLNGEAAHKNISALLAHSTHINLFDNHPPFQIDGNFGGTAGIAEMLCQSHEGYIRLLPALPKAWDSGHVKGLVARQSFVVSIKWEKGCLVEASMTSRRSGTLKIWIESNWNIKLINQSTDKEVTVQQEGNLIVVLCEKDESYKLVIKSK